MLVKMGLALFAVHIADNVLDAWCWGGGLAAAAALAVLGAWRVRDDEIPRIALLTSVYFVASAIHIPAWPTSIHLLLNGLVGVLLGWRACLAIPIGILLQYLLIQHGGFYTVGVNSVVQIVPALTAGVLYAGLRRCPWFDQPWFRSGLIGACTCVALLTVVYSVVLLWTNFLQRHRALDLSWANEIAFHPVTLALILTASGVLVWLQRRATYAPEFALGLLIGELTVLFTVALNNVVLLVGGEKEWREPALLLLVGSVPLAVVEGLIVGFTVAFLARVKPELLGVGRLQVPARAALTASVNGSLLHEPLASDAIAGSAARAIDPAASADVRAGSPT